MKVSAHQVMQQKPADRLGLRRAKPSLRIFPLYHMSVQFPGSLPVCLEAHCPHSQHPRSTAAQQHSSCQACMKLPQMWEVQEQKTVRTPRSCATSTCQAATAATECSNRHHHSPRCLWSIPSLSMTRCPQCLFVKQRQRCKHQMELHRRQQQQRMKQCSSSASWLRRTPSAGS